MDMIRRRLEKLLEALDDLGDVIQDEDFTDLNAEFEDALFMLSETDPEELEDALEAIRALAGDYTKWPEARELAREMMEAAQNG